MTAASIKNRVRGFAVFLCFVAGAVLAAGAFAEYPTVTSDQVSHDD